MGRELIISDLDGTLFDSSGHLSAATVEGLNRLIDSGMNFTFATARTIYSAGPLTRELKVNVPCILNNGASVYDLQTGEYVKNNYIPVETAARIITAFRENDLCCFLFKFIDGKLATCYDRVTEELMVNYVAERKDRFEQPFVECRSVLDENDGSAIYINTIGSYDALLPVREAVRGMDDADCAFYKDTYTDKWYLEIFSSEASKANGLRFIREKYGFTHVTAFGDNLNDVSLFEASDCRIAVQNAVPELKAMADRVLPLTNDQDAVCSELTMKMNNIQKGKFK